MILPVWLGSRLSIYRATPRRSRFLEFFSDIGAKKANRSGLLEKAPLYNVVEAPI